MQDPHLNRTKPASAGSQPAQPTRSVEREFRVRFYCAMRSARVHPLVVETRPVRGGHAAPASLPVVVRPVIAGALVAPAEQVVDTAQPLARATFHVTPLARGRLTDARVEVHHQGRTIDQLRMRMKSTTQRRTWVLLALTLLIPWFLLAITSERIWKLKGHVPGRPPDLIAEPGEVLEHRLTSWISTNVPDIPYSRQYVTNPAARGLGTVYTWACNLAPDYLYFWVGVVLFALVVLSWVSNRPQRTSSRKVLALTTPTPQAEATETLPLNPREQAPLLAQPIQ